MDFYTSLPSPIGPVLLRSDGEALTGLYLNRDAPGPAVALPVFDRTAAWLEDYFQGRFRQPDVPVRVKGTVFQQRVWNYLRTVPPGELCTYAGIAREMAREMDVEKMSAQAVGQAVGRNPVSILIPCHRCVGAKGDLTGYASGLERKVWLLRHEGWRIRENRIEK